MDKIRPYLEANNSVKNLEIVISFELGKFYDAAFCDGTENVLKCEVNR